MSLRNTVRKNLINASTLFRLDELVLRLQRQPFGNGTPRVLVVAMHETMARDADRFRRQLAWVAGRFTIISPQQFFDSWAKPAKHATASKPAILFTFDDGRESNYKVAAPILESLGARGLFFVVPDFIGLRGYEARDFYYRQIDVRGLPAAESEEVWAPMTSEQLADLVRRGHAVGNHTLSHASLESLSPVDLQAQVVGSAGRISSWIGKPAEAFAWPYAWNAITREAWELITKNHRFCFSPCPGTVRLALDSPSLLWRTEVESYYGEAEYRFMYSGLANVFWAGKREELSRTLMV